MGSKRDPKDSCIECLSTVAAKGNIERGDCTDPFCQCDPGLVNPLFCIERRSIRATTGCGAALTKVLFDSRQDARCLRPTRRRVIEIVTHAFSNFSKQCGSWKDITKEIAKRLIGHVGGGLSVQSSAYLSKRHVLPESDQATVTRIVTVVRIGIVGRRRVAHGGAARHRSHRSIGTRGGATCAAVSRRRSKQSRRNHESCVDLLRRGTNKGLARHVSRLVGRVPRWLTRNGDPGRVGDGLCHGSSRVSRIRWKRRGTNDGSPIGRNRRNVGRWGSGHHDPSTWPSTEPRARPCHCTRSWRWDDAGDNRCAGS